MAIRIHFTNGRIKELPNYEFDKLTSKLPYLGIKVWRPESGIAFPIQWEGVMLLEEYFIDDEESEEWEKHPNQTKAEKDAALAEETKVEEPAEAPEPAKTIEEPVKTEKPMSAQERADEKLEQMKKLSNCKHPEHEIYFSESSTGRSRKPVRRYFPVCACCGVREKFVKADSLPDEVKEAAQVWTDETSDKIKERFLNG